MDNEFQAGGPEPRDETLTTTERAIEKLNPSKVREMITNLVGGIYEDDITRSDVTTFESHAKDIINATKAVISAGVDLSECDLSRLDDYPRMTRGRQRSYINSLRTALWRKYYQIANNRSLDGACTLKQVKVAHEATFNAYEATSLGKSDWLSKAKKVLHLAQLTKVETTQLASTIEEIVQRKADNSWDAFAPALQEDYRLDLADDLFEVAAELQRKKKEFRA